jgi:septal ring factor EnvC (AmiA/AmiB activator)
MRVWIGLWLLLLSSSAGAEPPLTDQDHLVFGQRWYRATQYHKAIEEFEQGYVQNGKQICLYFMAESYERLAGLTAKTASEVLENKRRALEIYKSFVETAPPIDPALDKARERIESLPQEIKELEAQRAEQEASIKLLNENIKQLLAEIRALREQLPRREQGATSAGFMR